MPERKKYDSKVRRVCAKGASKLRLKSSTDAERSEGAAEILFCRGYRPRAGGLYLTKQGRPRKPTAKKASKSAKRRAEKNGAIATFKVYTLDVWGNKREGYQVNDRSYTGHVVSLSEDGTNGDLLRALKDEGLVRKTARVAQMDVDDSNWPDVVYVNRKSDGMPIFELSAE